MQCYGNFFHLISADYILESLPTACLFCFEPLGPHSSFRRLLCGHYFHLYCIDNWICQHNAICPNCRCTFYHLRRPQLFFVSDENERIRYEETQVDCSVIKWTFSHLRTWISCIYNPRGNSSRAPGNNEEGE